MSELDFFVKKESAQQAGELLDGTEISAFFVQAGPSSYLVIVEECDPEVYNDIIELFSELDILY